MTDDERELAAYLADLGSQDGIRFGREGNTAMSAYWQGWEDGLITFLARAAAGVKPSCYPGGTCQCHPELIRGMR